jgi:DhnA family fructose-bisphosphate aldolase class Ia
VTVPDGPALPFSWPALVLAADHRARGLITIEPYAEYVDALEQALVHCDGILASMQPLVDLSIRGAVSSAHRTYLSVNRTGLAGSTFEMDDRLVATPGIARTQGWTGIKHMTRIDRTDPATADALALLGHVLESAAIEGLEALVECVGWRGGAMARDTDSIVDAAVIAHDIGAPLLKVPVPDEPPGPARRDAVARVVASVGVPVLFLGGPRGDGARQRVLDEAADVMAGGGAGLAVGRTIYQDPDPAGMARALADIVHAG